MNLAENLQEAVDLLFAPRELEHDDRASALLVDIRHCVDDSSNKVRNVGEVEEADKKFNAE